MDKRVDSPSITRGHTLLTLRASDVMRDQCILMFCRVVGINFLLRVTNPPTNFLHLSHLGNILHLEHTP